MAISCLNSAGVPKKLEQSMGWFKQVAEIGSPIGICELGRSYVLGRGVPKDVNLGIHWIQKAAEIPRTIKVSSGAIYAVAYRKSIVFSANNVIN